MDGSFLHSLDALDWIVISEAWKSIPPDAFEQRIPLKEGFFEAIRKHVVRELEGADQDRKWFRDEIRDDGQSLQKAFNLNWGREHQWCWIGRWYDGDGTFDDDKLEDMYRPNTEDEEVTGKEIKFVFYKYLEWKENR